MYVIPYLISSAFSINHFFCESFIYRIINKIKLDKEPQDRKDVELKTWELLKKNGKEGRRTGLGFTGLADSLAAIGLKYDSQQALLQIDSIMRTKFQGEIDSTIDLSIQRGSFKGFSSDIEKLSDFVSKMMYLEFPEAWERMQEYGRRNVSFSTVAPTGTLSLLTQTSSGIEPVYMLSYKRRKKVNSPTKKSVTDNLGDHWEEYQVYHPKLDLWSKVTGNKDFEKSPYWGSEAKEINWEKRIAIQKVIKNYYVRRLNQNVVNVDIYINGDVYNSLTDHQKYAMEVASEAMITRNITNRAVENGKALIDLTENHGVKLWDTPADYFTEYMNAAQATLKKNAASNAFFKEVYEHMTAHAKIVVPFIAQMETSDASIGTAFASQQ